ncbi:MAG TPA: hypothetical protein VED18_05180 [Candidatus Sulfotelmatobacter sp.]|nr:hypothetical protein [Candidatus Sulfotelmatobacter sp.]
MKKIVITLAALLVAAPAFANWPTPVEPNGPNSGAGRDIMLPQGEASGAGRVLASLENPSQGEVSAGRSSIALPQGEASGAGRSIA